jgi:hypothetical protein
MLFFSAKEYHIYFSYNIRTGETHGNLFYSKWAELFVRDLGPEDGNKLEVLASKLKESYPTAEISVFFATMPGTKSNKNILY